MREIDFETEITNMQNCRDFFQSNPSIYVPQIYRQYSSPRICMMEYIHGIKASNITALQNEGIDTRQVASLCIEAFARMIFQAPFLHVDPHAGNLFVRFIPGTKKPQLVLLDHGMYNYTHPGFTEFMQELWLAMVKQDQNEVERLCSIYGMQKYGQLLSLSLTGRSLSSQNKLRFLSFLM